MKNLFIVILRYVVPIEAINAHHKEHIKFLDDHYESGDFIASGPQIPRNGGVIIAKSDNRLTLEKLLKQDPFAQNNLAEYQIFEFTPVRHVNEFKTILS